MRLLLSSAVARCLSRRAATASRRTPVAALALVAVAVGLPIVAWRVSRTIAVVVSPALADPTAARLLMAGFALPAAAGGAVMVVALTRPAVLMSGVLSAPAGRLDRLAAVLLLPLVTTSMGVAPTAVAVLAPLARQSPGGLGCLPAIVAALAVSGAAGASLALTCRVMLGGCGTETRLRAVAVAACLFGAAAMALAGSADALVGSNRGVVFAIAVSILGVVGFVGSLESLLSDEGQRALRRARSWSVPLAPCRATAVAGGALLARRPEVHTAVLGALLVGAAGIAIGVLATAPPPTGALVAVSGAVVVLAPAGLAVSGVICDGRTLWSLAPPLRAVFSAVLVCVSAIPVATAGVIVAGTAVLAQQALITDLLPLAGLVAGSWVSALIAGAIVPWTRAGAGGQSASLGAFAVVGGIAALCSARVAAAWPVTGGVAIVTWGLVGLLSLGAATATLASLAGRRV